MKDNNMDRSDESHTEETVSIAAATVHSDDFQIPQPSLRPHRDSVLDEKEELGGGALRDEERCVDSTTLALENDSRVPSVSSRASITSTSSCQSSTTGLNDQQDSRNIESRDNGEVGKGRKTRTVLQNRRKREAKRVAWERSRSASNRGSTSSCPSPPQAVHQGGGHYRGCKGVDDEGRVSLVLSGGCRVDSML